MTLPQLAPLRGLRSVARQTDRATFAKMYYDPHFHTAEISTRFGVAQSRLSEFAKMMDLETRRDRGIQYTPTLNKTRPKFGPCDRRCPGWRECTEGRLWAKVEPLPCETMLEDEIGVDFEADSSPTVWVMPLEVRDSYETA